MRNENIFFVCLLAIILLFASCANHVTRVKGTAIYRANRYYNTSFSPFHFWRRPGRAHGRGYYAHPRHHFRHIKRRGNPRQKHSYYRFLRKSMASPKHGWYHANGNSK